MNSSRHSEIHFATTEDPSACRVQLEVNAEGRKGAAPWGATHNDFMHAQKGLRFHLGEEKFLEFEARFLEKTPRYPGQAKAKNAR